MWCNCNGWSSCGCGRQITRSCGCARQSTCGCGCGCGCAEDGDFALDSAFSDFPVYVSIPTWLNGQNNNGSSGCGCG